MRFSLRNTAYIIGVLSLVPSVYFGSSYLYEVSYERPVGAATSTPVEKKEGEKWVATHIPTPEPVKAIYMTACVAGTPSWRKNFISLVNETELNAVVIDIKDYTGAISFIPENPLLKENKAAGCRAGDMRHFIEELHKNGIYVIGRITVFQDPYYTKIRPDLAVKSFSTGGVWKDYKGLSFVDSSAKEFWDYIVALSEDSYNAGFDELNYDYIRFPSDGNMQDVHYSWSTTTTKALALRNFYEYLYARVKPTGAVLSADLFGMTTTNFDDLNVGQVLEYTLPYFDYVSPMVYPSHYPKWFNGWQNPNLHVYDVVYFSLSRAVARAMATTTPVWFPGGPVASTTPGLFPKPAYDKQKLRPWLQDFDYGGNYDAAAVRAQIQATYDTGLTSWMLWDPGNSYTRAALLPEPSVSSSTPRE